MKKIIVVFVIVLIAGCGSMQIDMDSFIQPPSCNIEVIDNRPYKYIVSDSFRPMEIVPEGSIEKILKAKLCNSEIFLKWYGGWESVSISIDEISFMCSNFITHADGILFINGTIKANTINQQIKASAVIKMVGFIWNAMPDLINKCLDDFVNKIEKTILVIPIER
jgi:hypothetical protein